MLFVSLRGVLQSVAAVCSVVAGFSLTPTAAIGADFRLNLTDEWQGDITVRGEIRPGDLGKLKAVLGGRSVQKGMPIYLDLNSQGGNFHEAIKIGRFALDNYLSTKIGRNSQCLSACAVIFMAGTRLTTVGNSLERRMHVTARLGFHAPFIGVAGMADANQPYDEAVDAVGGDLLALARFRGRKWLAPLIKSDLINEMMMRRGANYFYIDTVRKAAEFEIDIDGVMLPAVTAANIKVGCSNALALHTSSALADATWYGDVTSSNRSDGRTYTVPINRGQCSVIVTPKSQYTADYATVSISENNGEAGTSAQMALWFFWPGDRSLTAISGGN